MTQGRTLSCFKQLPPLLPHFDDLKYTESSTNGNEILQRILILQFWRRMLPRSRPAGRQPCDHPTQLSDFQAPQYPNHLRQDRSPDPTNRKAPGEGRKETTTKQRATKRTNTSPKQVSALLQKSQRSVSSHHPATRRQDHSEPPYRCATYSKSTRTTQTSSVLPSGRPFLSVSGSRQKDVDAIKKDAASIISIAK